MKKYFMLFIGAMMLTAVTSSCGEKEDPELTTMMQQIRDAYENHHDQECIDSIQSLRERFPNAIEARKECLTLFQNASLRIAEEDLARTDSALEAVKTEYQHLKKNVDAHRAALNATAQEMTALTLKKMERDSLQTRFDALCLEIRLIHKRQKE